MADLFFLSAHPECVACLHFEECSGRNLEEGEECPYFAHYDLGKHVRH